MILTLGKADKRILSGCVHVVGNTFETKALQSRKQNRYHDSIFLYKNSITFNLANSSIFALLIQEGMDFAEQNPFRSYNSLLSWELLNQA